MRYNYNDHMTEQLQHVVSDALPPGAERGISTFTLKVQSLPMVGFVTSPFLALPVLPFLPGTAAAGALKGYSAVLVVRGTTHLPMKSSSPLRCNADSSMSP